MMSDALEAGAWAIIDRRAAGDMAGDTGLLRGRLQKQAICQDPPDHKS